MNGVEVRKGQYIGLLDGELAMASDSPEVALRSTLALANLNRDAIVTVYCGADRLPADATLLATELKKEYPGIQVDLLEGGQPIQQYLASVE